MKQLYILGAVLAIVLLVSFLGYKVVKYAQKIDAQEETIKEKDKEIKKLKEDNSELNRKYQDLQDERNNQKPKVVRVTQIVEKEVTRCDNDLIGDKYVDGLRSILSTK